jgi:imidazolonepropionase-like amidohydrolase
MNETILVLEGGTLINGTGSAPVPDAVILIRGRFIEAVGPSGMLDIPPGARRISTAGKTVMPGLIDAHIHLQGVLSTDPLELVFEAPEVRCLRSAMDLWRLLDAGFTTVRDCGEPNALYLKKAVSQGSILGPRIFSCGVIITQTGGHGDPAHSLPAEWIIQRGLTRMADGADECRKAAREQLRRGADFIKFCSTGGVLSETDAPGYSQYSLPELQALVEEAHRAGKKAAVHAQGAEGIRNALMAGVDTVEHASLADEETIAMMADKGVIYVPTLSLGRSIVERGAAFGVPPLFIEKARKIKDMKLRSFELACKAGLRMACGSDYLSDPMTPMGENAVELVHQVASGRAPMDVIVSATRIGAEALGIENEVGTLEPGKLADLIIVDGNPVDDIGILKDRSRISAIYKEGREMPRFGELHDLLRRSG